MEKRGWWIVFATVALGLVFGAVAEDMKSVPSKTTVPGKLNPAKVATTPGVMAGNSVEIDSTASFPGERAMATLVSAVEEYRERVDGGEIVELTSIGKIKVGVTSATVVDAYGAPDHQDDIDTLPNIAATWEGESFLCYSKPKLLLLIDASDKVSAILLGALPENLNEERVRNAAEDRHAQLLGKAKSRRLDPQEEELKRKFAGMPRDRVVQMLGEPKYEGATLESRVLNSFYPFSRYAYFEKYKVLFIFTGGGQTKDFVFSDAAVVELFLGVRK